MRSKIIRIVVWGAVAIAVVVVVYLRYTRMRVDRLIGEANDMIDEGEAKQKELGLEGNQLLSGSLTKDFLVASAAKTDPKETDVFTDTATDRSSTKRSWPRRSLGPMQFSPRSWKSTAASRRSSTRDEKRTRAKSFPITSS